MSPGNLVYHKEDVRDSREIPGLVVRVSEGFSSLEAIVHFTDRPFAEKHEIEQLIKVETHEYNKTLKLLEEINDYR
jgi:hypothetical protein